MQQLLGPITYQDMVMEVSAPPPMPGPTIKKGRALMTEDDGYTDGFCWGQPPTWRAVADQPSMGSMWMEDGSGQSSQWIELRAV